jgi:hypothetical protein
MARPNIAPKTPREVWSVVLAVSLSSIPFIAIGLPYQYSLKYFSNQPT